MSNNLFYPNWFLSNSLLNQLQILNYMFAHQMADLLKGKFDKILERFLVVDCRYPYEYEGGHVVVSIRCWVVSMFL